mgnify:CR=1 FL=1
MVTHELEKWADEALHPGRYTLAQWSSGDLPGQDGQQVGDHVRECSFCSLFIKLISANISEPISLPPPELCSQINTMRSKDTPWLRIRYEAPRIGDVLRVQLPIDRFRPRLFVALESANTRKCLKVAPLLDDPRELELIRDSDVLLVGQSSPFPCPVAVALQERLLLPIDRIDAIVASLNQEACNWVASLMSCLEGDASVHVTRIPRGPKIIGEIDPRKNFGSLLLREIEPYKAQSVTGLERRGIVLYGDKFMNPRAPSKALDMPSVHKGRMQQGAFVLAAAESGKEPPGEDSDRILYRTYDVDEGRIEFWVEGATGALLLRLPIAGYSKLRMQDRSFLLRPLTSDPSFVMVEGLFRRSFDAMEKPAFTESNQPFAWLE